MVIISDEPVCEEKILNSFKGPNTGAIVTFTGVVRGKSGNKEILSIFYESHPALAEKQLENIIICTKSDFEIQDVGIYHRIGMVEAGEASVFIAVTAEHRKDAFNACENIINEIKSKVPVWKKEIFKNGSKWVNGKKIKS
ncbi:molybdenum cofactor biosynthesis protein MoaE [candidate division KSB1 bacterium]